MWKCKEEKFDCDVGIPEHVAMSISIYMRMNETHPSRIQDELFA